jgi:Leucine-rich repeat (LRR) protein
LGISSNYPIKVGAGVYGGPRNEIIYLKNLEDTLGRKVVFKRAGNCCQYPLEEAPLGIASLDIYIIGFVENDSVIKTKKLYLTYYEYEKPIKAPIGFKFKTETIGDSLEINKTNILKKYGKEKIVRLTFDKLTKIPDYIFDLTQIEELYISYNQLTQIPQEIGNLKNLRILEFQDNKIKTLPETMSNMDSLTAIFFCNNMDWEQTFSVLSKCKNFKNASFREVGLNAIPSAILQCQNIEKIDLIGNSKINYEKAFDILSKLKNLKELTLSIYTKTIPPGIDKLKSLQILNIEFSEIETIPNEIGNLTNLRELHFRYCDKLTKIPRSIKNCRNLSKVSLYSMREPFDFAYSIKSLQGLDLTYLDLSQARNIKIPTEIYTFKNLKFLGLNIYESDTIPDGIGELKNLEEIILSPGDFKYFPPDFENLHSLKRIDLSGIFDIDFEHLFSILISLKSLEEIDINYGEQRLPDSISKLKSIKKIIMTNYKREYVSEVERIRHKNLLPNCEFIY